MNPFLARPLVRRVVALTCAAMLGTGALTATAQTLSPTAQNTLNYAKQLYGFYKSQQNASGYLTATQQLNTAAVNSAGCQAIGKAGENAAAQYLKAAIPPDPQSIIQGTTCFIDVLSVYIPTTGIGFIDAFINQVVQFVQDKMCALTNKFWQEAMNKVVTGDFRALLGGAPLSFMISGVTSTTSTMSSVPAGGGSSAAASTTAPTSASAMAVAPTSADLQVFGGSARSGAAPTTSGVDTFVQLLSR